MKESRTNPSLLRAVFVVGFFLWADSVLAQWGQLTIVDTSTNKLISQDSPHTAVGPDGTLGVVWLEQTSDNIPIVYLHSSDQGGSFQKAIVVDAALGGSGGPFPTANYRHLHEMKFGPDGTIWVLWIFSSVYDGLFVSAELRLSRSTDSGKTFVEVFSAPTSQAFEPQLAVTKDGSLFILWDSGRVNIGPPVYKCTRFSKGDISRRLDGSFLLSGLPPIRPTFAVDSMMNVICVWGGYRWNSSSRTSTSLAFGAISRDSGRTFSQQTVIDSSDAAYLSPSVITAQQGRAFVAYVARLTRKDGSKLALFVSQSDNPGLTFKEPVVVSDTNVNTLSTVGMAFHTRAGLVIVWDCDDRIYWSHSHDEGLTFAAHQVIDPVNVGYSPTLSLDSLGNGFIFAGGAKVSGFGNLVRFSKASIPTSVPRYPSLQKDFVLGQNYPNPFNPATIVHFRLPEASHVTLRIFNILGQIVQALVDEQKQPGSYDVTWNAGALPSGVYFYTLQAGTTVMTRKALLLK